MNKKPWIIVGIVVCVIYILSPLDLIPEIPLGPIGVIDDAGVLAFMLFLIKQLWGLRYKKDAIDVSGNQSAIDDDRRPGDPPKLTDEQ
jgi:uncharacterized membrane protein YkvA (DUF1232 family)